ncbi:MAG: flippase [Patescibacteria group bacterium]|jgi:O-antigen/teichoic acid export membrane protein
MTLSGVLAKNATYLTLSSMAQKALAFWWFAYIAHQLAIPAGDELLGKYTFAVTYTSIFVILMNFGLIPVLTRQGAKNPERLQEYFKQALSLKIILTIVSVVVLIGLFHILNLYKPMPAYTVMLVYLAIGIIVFDTFRSVIFAVLRAQQLMQYEAIGQVFYQIAVVVIGGTFFFFGYKAGGLIIAINCASVLYLLYAVYILYRKTDIRLGWQWHWPTMRQLFIMAAPFALADIFFKLNGSIDTVMLNYLAGDRYVAWYSIALKLTITLTVLPGAFATAFFPAMSQALLQSKESFRNIFEQTSILLLFLSIPIALGTYVLAPDIIQLAFKDFPATIPALQLFMAGVVFLFANYPIGNALNAANKQLTNTLNMGIALGVNVVLNIILIPQYTYMGAALAATLSAIVLVLLGLPYVYQLTEFRSLVILKKAGISLLSASIMAVLAWWLQQSLDHTSMIFLLILSVCIIIYVGLLFVFGGVKFSEIKVLWQQMRTRS